MMYFDSTAWAFITWSVYLTPLLLMLIFSYYFNKVKKPITRFRLNIMYILSFVYVCVIYYVTFAHFVFGINILPDKNTIEIMRLFPERITVISMANILEVKIEPSYKGTYQMIIKTKDGKKYEGAPSNRSDVGNKTKLVKAALAR